MEMDLVLKCISVFPVAYFNVIYLISAYNKVYAHVGIHIQCIIIE